MTDREMLIELLAIKLYEHSSLTGEFPPKMPGPWWRRKAWPSWRARRDIARQHYRDMVAAAATPEELYK